ncbi:MAG: CHASE2 domain-containing protein [Burkholderiales bacterium]|nr:CHASE2 domain-containing protein [Burkholderiales bacterium]
MLLPTFMLTAPAPVAGLRHALFDQYQRIFPRERQSMPAVIVGIDESALEIAGQWPWPRTRVAELLARIQAQRPAAIGLDITFNEPDRLSPGAIASSVPGLPQTVVEQLRALPSHDTVLADQIRASPVVMALVGEADAGASALKGIAPLLVDDQVGAALRHYPGYQGSLEHITQGAFTQAVINGDSHQGVIRSAPILANVRDTPVPGLSLAMLQAATGSAVLATTRRGGQVEVAVDQLRIPASRDGTFWIWFGRLDRYDRIVSAGAVLRGEIKPDTFENKLVLIGATGLGLLDYKTTPLGEFVPGVDIHAQMIEQMFDGTFLRRPVWFPAIEISLLLASVMLIRHLAQRVSANRLVLIAVGLALAQLVAGLITFRLAGGLLDVAWSAVGTLLAGSLVLADNLAQSERQRRALREQAARISGELSAAQRIQMGLLPKPQEVFAGERRFAIAALLEPARTVGGDFYDCFMLDSNQLFFVVADVSGKGLPAALFMAAVKSHMKSAALASDEHLSTVMRRAQDDIARENPESLFVTAFAGILDTRSGRLVYTNAGHEPPFAGKPDGTLIRLERADGPPLGTLENFEYSQGERQLVAGEWLCILTDGVTDATNPDGELFGIARIRAALEQPSLAAWPGEVVKRLQSSVSAFVAGAVPADDLTLLVVRWNGPAH